MVELTELVINNHFYPIITDKFGLEGDRSGTLKKVGAGAAVGAILDGKDGAAKGAGVGAAISLLTKGKQLRIPVNTLLEFRLQSVAPVSISS